MIPTGCLLDITLGVGGLPRGRLQRFWTRVLGKTTVAYTCHCRGSKLGGTAHFIDAEHALDPTIRKLLDRSDNLLVSQPDTGEQTLEITEALVRSGAVDIVVIDSVAALVPKAEIEGNRRLSCGFASPD